MSSAKRGRHAKRAARANRASGFAFAVGLGMAVATSPGVASASTDDGQQTGSADTDTGSTAANSNDKTQSASTTSGSSGTTTETTTTATSGTSTGTQTTTTTTGESPTSTVSASGGSGTTVSGEGTKPTTEPTTEPTGTNSGSTTQAEATTPITGSTTEATPETETTVEAEGKQKSTTAETEQAVTPVVETQTLALTEEAAPLGAAVNNAEAKPEVLTTAPTARMTAMAATASPASTALGLPTVTLPPYPTIAGVSPTKVALAVVIILGKALQSALSGPVPNPIAIPIYMVLVAAYQRLAEIALNHVPVAGTPSTPLNVPLTGLVVGNIGTATDQDGDPLTYTVTTQGAKGTVALVGTEYVYTPNTLFPRDSYNDTFTVTISDIGGAVDHPYAPNGHTTTQEINLTVDGTGIDVPPIVTPIVGARDSLGFVRGNFLVVDADDLTGAGRTFSLANGNTPGATATSAYTSLGGIVSLNQTTGNWTYVPAVSGHNILGIPTNTDTFVVTVDDGHVGGAVQTTVSVGADLGIETTGTGTNPTSGAYSGSLNIPASPDPDNGLLTYSIGTGPSAKGSLFVNAQGGFIYTPTAAARHAAAATNATLADKTDSFTIKGTDANGRSITVATVSVTLSTTNTDPTGTATFNAPDASSLVTGSVAVTDADNDTLTYSGTAGKGTVVFTGTNFTYTPDAGVRHAAAADNASTATKQDTIDITVDDGHGGVKTFTQTFNITPQNTVPTFTSVTSTGGTILNLTKTWTINGAADADGDTLTYAVTSLPTGGLLNVPVPLGNVVTLLTVLTTHGSFTYTMSDGHGGNVPFVLTY